MMDQCGSDDIRALVMRDYSLEPPQERKIGKEAQLVAGGMAGPDLTCLLWLRSMEYSSILRIAEWLAYNQSDLQGPSNPANHRFIFPQ